MMSVSARTRSRTGSLVTRCPGLMVTARSPRKVTSRTVPGVMSEVPDRRPTAIRSIRIGAEVACCARLILRRGPPWGRCTTVRTVWSLNVGPATCWAVAHDACQVDDAGPVDVAGAAARAHGVGGVGGVVGAASVELGPARTTRKVAAPVMAAMLRDHVVASL